MILSPNGIKAKSIGRSWNYSWDEIDCWGTDKWPAGDSPIWFKVKGRNKKQYFQPCNGKQEASVIDYLQTYHLNLKENTRKEV